MKPILATPFLPRRGALALLPLLLALAAGCSTAQSPPAPPPPVIAPAGDELPMAAIRRAVGDAPCTADAQCRTLPIGAKACGGPAGYLAWSTANLPSADDEARLKSLAARDAAADRARQQREGILSNCSVTIDPGAQCVAGRCTLRSGNVRAPGGRVD